MEYDFIMFDREKIDTISMGMNRYDFIGIIVLFTLIGLITYIYLQGDTLELKCVI